MAAKLLHFIIESEDMIIEYKETLNHYFYRRYLCNNGIITKWKRVSCSDFEDGLCTYYNV